MSGGTVRMVCDGDPAASDAVVADAWPLALRDGDST